MQKRDFKAISLRDFRLGVSPAESVRQTQKAFGEESVNIRTVRNWYAKFRLGDYSLEDKHGGGMGFSIDDERLKQVVEQNPRTTVREIAEELGAAKSTVHRHLQAIGKVKKLEQWVPHELTDMNKKNRMIIAHSLLNRQRSEDFLDRLITCDEKWILYDNRRRSAQWLDKDEPAKHIPKPALHSRKTMVTVWWTAREVIHYSFFQQVNSSDKNAKFIQNTRKHGI